MVLDFLQQTLHMVFNWIQGIQDAIFGVGL